MLMRVKKRWNPIFARCDEEFPSVGMSVTFATSRWMKTASDW